MKLALIFGGSSYEHEISIVSAITVLNKIKDRFEITPIFIDSKRDFYLIDIENMKSKFFSSKEYLKKAKKLHLNRGGFESRGFFGSTKVDFDVAINLIHGRDGEDGKLASILEFFDIDYIGPRVEGSAISYNKLFTKLFAKEIGVDVIEYKLLREDDKREIPFSYPVIVKPLRLGSSIGVVL